MHMIHQSLLVALALLIQTDLLAVAQIICSNGNYTSNTSNNLNATLFSTSTNIDSNGFYNTSTGQGGDVAVNVVALCRGDVQLDKCRDCLHAAATGLVKSCPNSKQAIVWDNSTSCMLRYSNETTYGVLATVPMHYWWIRKNVTSPEQFKADLRVLLDSIRKQAVIGTPVMKVAAGNVTAPDFQTIFALVQCTPDLSSDECNNCLIRAISRIPECCDGRAGGRVLQPSCTIRFETDPFFNESRLQELHAPPPVVLVPLPPPKSGKKKGNTTRTIIITAAATGACLVLVVSIIIFLRKRNKQKQSENPHTIDEISGAESLQYNFNTIKAATDDFSDDNKLGQGGFGTVYKGKLPYDQEIAVKRLSMDSGQGDIEFKNEVLLLAKLQHRNLVRLLGFALEGVEKLLVYEFVQNASLDHFLFDSINHSKLDWDIRYKIIVGIARGMLYLHEDSRLRIIHRDLKASNILLDKEMNPKISDFGMARLFGQDETHGSTSRVVGTYGYMPPEYLIHGQFSIKSDVFSFGVLVLELISGRKNNNFPSGESVVDLVSFAWKSWEEGRAGNIVDSFMRSGLGSMNEMVRCIHIGLLCVQEDAVVRPTMANVVLMLSSFSIALSVPSRPAFYSPTGYASDVSLIDQGYSFTNSDKKSSEQTNRNHSSRNDDSSTDMYPR